MYLMGTPVSISGPEAADRLQIRELVDAYAHLRIDVTRRDIGNHFILLSQFTLHISDITFILES
jgi:hypothetical protein